LPKKKIDTITPWWRIMLLVVGNFAASARLAAGMVEGHVARMRKELDAARRREIAHRVRLGSQFRCDEGARRSAG
jgi:hypothetical protein